LATARLFERQACRVLSGDDISNRFKPVAVQAEEDFGLPLSQRLGANGGGLAGVQSAGQGRANAPRARVTQPPARTCSDLPLL
jgi:hypothetical protein